MGPQLVGCGIASIMDTSSITRFLLQWGRSLLAAGFSGPCSSG